MLPRSHPLTRRPFVSVSDLKDLVVFANEATPQDMRLMRDLLIAERAHMPDVHIVPLTDALVDLVEAGLGVGLGSRWAVSPHEARGQIVTRRFTKDGVGEQWSAVFRSDAAARLPLSRFVELMRAHAPFFVAPLQGQSGVDGPLVNRQPRKRSTPQDEKASRVGGARSVASAPTGKRLRPNGGWRPSR